jgi:hypothetical protein
MEAAVGWFDRAVAALGRAGVRRGVASSHAHAAAAFAAGGDFEEAAARLLRARDAASGDAAAERVVAVFEAAVDVMKGGDVEAARALLVASSRAEIATPELVQATRVLSGAVDGAPRAREAAVIVGPEARWIALGGERIDLARYGPVRRLFDRLVTSRLEAPGASLSAEALIAAGWPGERMRHSAGLLRVYSAIRRLRRLGLEQVLVTRDDGYLLDPDAVIRRED